MSGRRLVSTERSVGDADLPRYGRAWEAVQAAVEGAGAHAWRFQSARDPLLFIEFLEFRGDDPRRRPEVAAALRALHEFGPATSREWQDAPSSGT